MSQKITKKAIIWSREQIALFLATYEQHPCLYNTQHKYYSNKNARIVALEQIRDALNIKDLTTEDVKTKINSVRTQISHELKKRKDGPSGSSADDVPEPVWWFDQANFLIPHMKCRKSRDSLEQEQDLDVFEEEDIPSSENTTNLFSPTTTRDSDASKRKKKRRLKHSDAEDASLLLVSTLNIMRDTLQGFGKENIPEEVFGNYVAKEISGISDPSILLECKHEITNVIYRYKKMFLEKCTEEMNFEVQKISS